MKLVIEIDDITYKDTVDNGIVFDEDNSYVATAIKNGTPLTERPKGHWEKEKSILGWDECSYQCSNCGRSIHLDTVMEDLSDYPYCHCGAKMEINNDKQRTQIIE